MEKFRIKPGDSAAWYNYYLSGSKEGGIPGALIFHPDDEVNQNRNILATYLEVERDFNKHLLVNVAARYEYYSDFGGNLAGKLAVRYRFSEEFSLRASASNGFRAPSLQQTYFATTTYGTIIRNGLVVDNSTRIFHNNSEVAKSIGIPPLDAEKSVNLSAGFMATILPTVNLTVDAYWIQIKNRIVLSGAFDRRTNPEIDAILKLHKVDIDRVIFFTNAINTRTKGVDIVLSSNWKIKKSKLAAIFAANFSMNNIFGEVKSAGNLSPNPRNTNTLFNRFERVRIEKGQPADKIILSLEYRIGRLGFAVRNTQFGRTVVASIDHPDNTALDEFFSSKIITDINVNFIAKKWVSITAGANNVFNVYPDRIKNSANTGEGMLIYGQEGTPFGINGGYYFISMGFSF
jgi:iron complex outermembrane receptor protein